MKALKNVLGGVAFVLGVITFASAIPDIARYIRISRM
jgi:predicted membrane channel-forming protein YqfA (hemolysin III family)